MADSNITKKALATAFQILVAEKNSPMVTIGEICDRCEMNRKSFYYHFRDKYDLINWIYKNDIERTKTTNTCKETWTFLKDACVVFGKKIDFIGICLN